MSHEPKPRGRQLNHRGRKWQWKFGDPLLIWDDKDTKHFFHLHQIFGYGVDRDREKRNFALRPKQVVEVIDRFILGYDDRKGFPPGVLPEDFVVARKQGYEIVAGPRGKWQVSTSFFFNTIISPEGIEYHPPAEELMGKEWVDAMMAFIREHAAVVREANPDMKVMDAWEAAKDTLTPPKPNFKAIRAYLQEHFGALETADE